MSKLSALKESSIIHTKDGSQPFVNPKENAADFVEIMASGLYGKVEDFYDEKIYPHLYDHRLKKCAAVCEKVGCKNAKEHADDAMNYWDGGDKRAAMERLAELHNNTEQMM